MTTILTLEFSDDEQALIFTQNHLISNGAFDDYKITGAYKKPEDHCKCVELGIKFKGYTRGQIHGWWVCASCKKMPRQAIRSFCMPGINLIPQAVLLACGVDIPKDRQDNPSWVSSKEWIQLNGSINTNRTGL